MSSLSCRRLLLRIALVLAVMLTAPVILGAQTLDSVGKTVVGDTRGKDFWLAFPQNARLENNHHIQLRLFITSDRATNGSVSVPGLNEHVDFHLDPSEIRELDIDTTVQLLESETVQKLGVHVVAESNIAVFGLSHRDASTDSYLAFPTNVLGTAYRAVGYYSAQAEPGFTSEFVVVATEDHTIVNISTTADTRAGHKAGETFSVEMNQGDTYMVQGTPQPGRKNDLTGTLVTSSKPIGFLTGHACAQVPTDVMYCDQLVEMEPPIPSWGRQFYVGRLDSKTEYAMRVVASEDSTLVFVNNKLVSRLSAGGYFENNHMIENSFVTSSKPVMVAEYAQSSEADSVKVGDPFMYFITPSEQFLNYYRFATPTQGAWHHYINLTVPTDAISSLRVDGRPVPPQLFHTIGISKFALAQYEIGYGSHAVVCDKPFGLYSYGFTPNSGSGDSYDSYGNDGGQLVQTIPIVADTARPILELTSDDGSQSLAMIARDDRLFDVGLAKIVVIDSQNFRTPVEVPKFDAGTPEVPLLFRISDYSSCGFMSLKLTDVAGNVSYWVICRTHVYKDAKGQPADLWQYTLTEGRTNICPSCRSWTVQFIATPSFTVSDVTFTTPAYLKGEGTYDHFSSRLSGGFQGMFIYPIDKQIQLAGGIGFSNFSGAAVSRHSTFVSDSILYGDTAGSRKSKLIEDFTTEASVNYLTLNGGMYYYAIPEKLYLYAGLAAGFLLESSFVQSSQIVYPSTIAYSDFIPGSSGRSIGSRTLQLAQGSLPDATTFHIALELSPGVQFKLSNKFSLLTGAYLNMPFFDAVTDLNWHFTTFGARIGIQYRN